MLLWNKTTIVKKNVFQQEIAKPAEEPKAEGDTNISPNVYFLRQFVSNACGTIALIHGVANNAEEYVITICFLIQKQ